MARTVQEIYEEMVAEKERRTELAGLTSPSATAVWRLMLYVVAYAAHVLEQLWDAYSAEVDARIEAIIPHRPKWYRDKVLAFMEDTTLVPDTDRYDTTGLTDEEIAARLVVKHATAGEDASASLLTIKVAGEEDGRRAPLPAGVETQLKAYIDEIKDAGVRYLLVNQEADTFNCTVDIYYDPMKLASTVEADCRAAITDYIENLPFNGEYTNMALVDRLQAVDGVKIAELKSASSSTADVPTPNGIDARAVPEAGYFQAGGINLNMVPYNS